MLSGAGACGTEAWALTVAVLLARLPGKRQVLRLLRAAGGDGGELRAAGERAVDAAVHHAASSVQHLSERDLAEAGAEVGVVAGLIEELGEAAGPQRLAALAALRVEADRSCRSRFQASLESELLGVVRSVPAGEPEVVKGLEATARELRRFEREARRIGGAEAYDALLRRAAAGVGAAELTVVERVRLVEILAGPEEAMRLFRAGAG